LSETPAGKETLLRVGHKRKMVLKLKRRNMEDKKNKNKQGCAVRGIEFIII